jgi:3-dehydroquinate synthase
LRYLGSALVAAAVPSGARVAIVTNDTVGAYYLGPASDALRAAGFGPFACVIPDGEEHKTLETVRSLYEAFLEGDLDRQDAVLALGGGVTGDIAGFAAATYMRGVRFVQVPTTLLAMTDASVGAKTGVDLPRGKNLVGAFKQPELVFIDLAVLETLSRDDLRAGMAEVLKHGIIGDPQLFRSLGARLGGGDLMIAASELARSIRVKIDVVQEDPFESGRRAVLNLGHTAGHALELLSGYTIRHGEAVAIGIVVAARIAERMDLAAPSLPSQIAETLKAVGLPTSCPPFRVEAIWDAMRHDKKRRGRRQRWILPAALGNAGIHDDVPELLVKQVLAELGAKE